MTYEQGCIKRFGIFRDVQKWVKGKFGQMNLGHETKTRHNRGHLEVNIIRLIQYPTQLGKKV